jgi:hypothetical protein
VENTGGLLEMSIRRCERLPIVILAQRHSTTGGSEHHGKILARFPSGLAPRFQRSEQQQLRGAIHSLSVSIGQSGQGEIRRQVRFGRHLDALAGDVKECDRSDGHATAAKAFRIFFPTAAKGG